MIYVTLIGRGYLADEEENSANDKERMNPETQFQRSRTGLRFPIGNTTSAFTRPTPDAEMKKIKVVLPKEDAAFSEPPSSRNTLQTFQSVLISGACFYLIFLCI